MKKIAIALLSNSCKQPKFYLQAQEQTPVIRDLTEEFSAADSLLEFSMSPAAPPAPPVLAPPAPVPAPPVPAPPAPLSSSAWHTTISKKRLRFLEKEAKRMNTLKKALRKKNSFASPISQRILGSAVARSGISFYDAELLCAASVRAFLHDVGITAPALNEKVARSCTPSRATFTEYIDETAAEKLAYLRESVKGKFLYLSCDKGNKKGIAHFVKIISYWNEDENKVSRYLLNCEASGGTSKNCANAINVSFTRLDDEDFYTLLSGQCTDAGGWRCWSKFIHRIKNCE